MKKILFTLITITFSINAFCQATDQNVGTVDFPEPASKITREKIREHIVNKLENDPIYLKTLSSRNPEHEYIIKDVLVDINFTNLDPGQKVDINKRKKENDAVFFNNKTYKSEIKDFNGNQALIISRVASGNIESYSFLLYNKAGTKVISGMLDYHKNNKETAKKILEHLLTHAKFKD